MFEYAGVEYEDSRCLSVPVVNSSVVVYPEVVSVPVKMHPVIHGF